MPGVLRRTGCALVVAIGASPTPFATSVSLAQPLVVPFAYGFTGQEPPGTYFACAAIVPPGAPPLTAALSLNVTPFTFAP